MTDIIRPSLLRLVLVLIALMAAHTPAAEAQSKPSFSGTWEGMFALQRPDGTEGEPRPVLFDLTQKGTSLTGTAGPVEQQWKIEKGGVANGRATFEVQQPDGPLFKFALTLVKGRLQGEMTGERDGVVRGKARVDAGRRKDK